MLLPLLCLVPMGGAKGFVEGTTALVTNVLERAGVLDAPNVASHAIECAIARSAGYIGVSVYPPDDSIGREAGVTIFCDRPGFKDGQFSLANGIAFLGGAVIAPDAVDFARLPDIAVTFPL